MIILQPVYKVPKFCSFYKPVRDDCNIPCFPDLHRLMLVYGLLLLFQIVNLFNMFITYGDTFLPTPSSYDELYYEIIRMHQSFDNLYSMGKGFSLSFFFPCALCVW